MTPYEINLTLSERGEAQVTFSATFMHFEREWETDGLMIQFASDDYEEEFEFSDLDKTSQTEVQTAVDDFLKDNTPSKSESREALRSVRDEHDFDCDKDLQD